MADAQPLPADGLAIAGPADLPALVELLTLLFAQEADFTPDPERQMRGLRLLQAQPDIGQILVWRQAGVVCGMVSLLYTISTALGGRVAGTGRRAREMIPQEHEEPLVRGHRGVGRRAACPREDEAGQALRVAAVGAQRTHQMARADDDKIVHGVKLRKRRRLRRRLRKRVVAYAKELR